MRSASGPGAAASSPPTDDAAACPASRAVLGYDFWQRELGGRDSATDASLLIDERPHEIVGVAPPGFNGLMVGDRFDVALPLCRQADSAATCSTWS